MSDDRKPEELYAAVLLPREVAWRHVKRMGVAGEPGGQPALYRDASSLPFLAEELIGQGVTYLAIDKNSMYFRAVENVPDAYRHRLIKVDKDNKCSTQLHAVMAPILHETGVELEGVSGARMKNGSINEVQQAAAVLSVQWLHPYLIALEYALQVDLNLDAIRTNLSVLDRHLSSRDARAHLAMLNLIFGTYEKRTVSEVALVPASTTQRAEAFQHFVEDATSKELSKERRLFGFPAFLQRALLKFDRLSEKIVSSSPLRSMLSLGTKTIETATKVPQADSKLLESLIPEGYLPPIISLGDATERAKAAWRRARPPFIPAFESKDDEGITFIADDEQPPFDS
jgi:hypothetical protein